MASRPAHTLRLATAVTGLGFFMVQLDVTAVNVALADIGSTLGTALAGLQWVVDAYALVFAALLLSGGAIGDRIGARRAFAGGLSVFAAASLACGIAPSATWLIAGRALQGVGAAFVVPCSLALLNHASGGDAIARARAIGFWTAAGGVAMAAGPVIGGLLVGAFGWPSIFLVNVPIGMLAAWLTRGFLDDVPAASGRFDVAGQLLAIVALFGLVGGAIEAGPLGWRNPIVILALASAVASFIGFIVVEGRRATPMLPLRLFRRRTFSAATLVGFLVNMSFYGSFFILGLYFQLVRHYSPAATGIAFIPLTGVVALSNVAAGHIAARFGSRLPMTAGFAIAAGGFGLLRGIDAATSEALLIPSFVLLSGGLGLTIPPMTTALLATVDMSSSGTASGVLNTVRQVGGAIGIAVFGGLLAGDATAIIHGIQASLMISAALSILAACISSLGIGPRRS